METGIETTYKVGDIVIATTQSLDKIIEREGVVIGVSENRFNRTLLYRVEVMIGGAPAPYLLAPEKIRLKEPIPKPVAEVQPDDRSLEREAAAHDFLVFANKAQQEEEAIQQVAQLITDSVNSGESKEEFEAKLADMLGVKLPADPPKKKRIRRTDEEQALQIPLDQILAYRADPDSWNKRAADPDFLTPEEEDAIQEEAAEHLRKSDLALQKICTDGDAEEEEYNALKEKADKWDALQRASGGEDHNQTIEKALDDYWEDKAAEYLAPPAETGRQIFERLGWQRIANEADESIAYTWDAVRINVEYDRLVCTICGEVLYFYRQEGWTLERYIKAVMDIWARNMNGQTVCVVGEEKELYAPPADPEQTFFQELGEELNPPTFEAGGEVAKEEESEANALMPQMELDALKPEVYNYEVMGTPPDGYVLGREKFNGVRWYVMYFKEAKRLAYLPGTTSVDDNTSQPPAYLTKWRYDMVARYGSVEAVEGFVDDTAAYGTIMHTLIAWYINGSLPVIGSQSWKDQVCMLITLQDGRIPDIYYPLWDRRLRKDLTCWNQFMIDRNVKVHLMEYACGSTNLGVAGQIDLVCTMDFNRGRVNAILDMKSGKKSTGQGNSKATQLGIYKLIFDEVFPGWKHSDTDKSPMGITKFFNWHPVDYNETPNKETGLVTPTYELVNQTDSVDFVEVDLQMKLFRHRTQGLKPGASARFNIEGELKPFTDNQALIKGGQRKDSYIEKYNLDVNADD